MYKIFTVVGTRPEIIKLSRLINIFDKNFNHQLVNTGQNFNYELNEIFFKDLKIKKPDYFLNSAKNTPSETIGKIIEKSDKILSIEKPDAILVLGDTNSCLSVISAKKRKIPIFHIEAGNRCFDQRVPEEVNRKIVDHISDMNLTYSNIARENLLRENIPADQVIKIGSPMYEVLEYNKKRIKSSQIIKKLKLLQKKYYLVSIHREENIEASSNVNKIQNILNTLAKNYKLPVIVSTHPRTRKMIEKKKIKFNPLVKTFKPFGFFDYINLQLEAKAVLSDSGSITEESSILNFPALNLRETHERFEGMEEASVMMVGLEIKNIINGLAVLENQSRGKKRDLEIVEEYNVKNTSKKVLRIILSYVDYIKRNIWKKFS